MLKSKLKEGLRRTATLLAATALIGFGFTGTARAFSIATGDLVGILVANGAELIANLGDPASPSTTAFQLPDQFGGTLATAKFIAVTVPDNTAAHGIVTFTADSSIDVPSFDMGNGALAGAIANAFQTLDQPSNDKWINNLNGIVAPNGTTIFANEADYLWLSTSNANGYTQGLDFGTDKINQSMPFSTALLFNGGDTASGNLWTAEGGGLFQPSIITLDGVIRAHDNGNNTVGFSVVPEPATALLVGTGLLGLAIIGRRRKAAA